MSANSCYFALILHGMLIALIIFEQADHEILRKFGAKRGQIEKTHCTILGLVNASSQCIDREKTYVAVQKIGKRGFSP